jgi:hypothetical protein
MALTKVTYSMIAGSPVNVLDYGADPTGVADSTAAINDAFNSGRSVYVPDGDYLIQSAFTATPSNIEIICDGFLVFDWATLGAVNAITFSGDYVRTRLKAKASDSAYVLTNRSTLQGYNCFLFTGDHCSANEGVSQNNPGFVKSAGSNARFTACGNTGYSVLDGLTQDPADMILIHINDGKGCTISNNSGYGFGHGILFGLSTDESVIDGNNFWNCANHCVYISSGDKNIVSNNRAEGLYTDIKVRGEYCTVVNNTVLGGALGVTNRVVDSGNGFGMQSALVDGNTVRCDRIGDYAINVKFRTDFDCKAQNIVVSNNAIEATVAVTYGIYIFFETIENVTVSGNSIVVDQSAAPTDAMFIAPTTFVLADANRITIANNTIENTAGQAIQVVGNKVAITGNSCVAAGSSGTNSGCVLVNGDEVAITGNTLEVTNNVGVLNMRTGPNGLAVGNILKRPSGGTVPHVNTDYVPVDANNVKIN